MTRPAETAGASGSLALIIARIAGIKDPDTLVAIGAAAGLVPALVTLIVANGGVKGALHRLWAGKATS